MNNYYRIYSDNIVLLEEPISTDDILPARYKHQTVEPAELAQHLFEDKYPQLKNKFRENTIIVSNCVFGIGSSREQAVTALKHAGVRAVITRECARIFFRNAWNNALPILIVEHGNYRAVNKIEIDFHKNYLNIDKQKLVLSPLPELLIKYLQFDGMLNYVINSK